MKCSAGPNRAAGVGSFWTPAAEARTPAAVPGESCGLACQSDENWFFGATAPKNNFQRRVGEGFAGAKR